MEKNRRFIIVENIAEISDLYRVTEKGVAELDHPFTSDIGVVNSTDGTYSPLDLHDKVSFLQMRGSEASSEAQAILNNAVTPIANGNQP